MFSTELSGPLYSGRKGNDIEPEAVQLRQRFAPLLLVNANVKIVIHFETQPHVREVDAVETRRPRFIRCKEPKLFPFYDLLSRQRSNY